MKYLVYDLDYPDEGLIVEADSVDEAIENYYQSTDPDERNEVGIVSPEFICQTCGAVDHDALRNARAPQPGRAQ